MRLTKQTKYRTLILAAVGFKFSLLTWFSFGPFGGPIAKEFWLSTGEIGTIGRIIYPVIYSTPWLTGLHTGQVIVAASVIPTVLLAAWVFSRTFPKPPTLTTSSVTEIPRKPVVSRAMTEQYPPCHSFDSNPFHFILNI